MCGIVSVFSKRSHGFNYKDLQIFEQLLYADVLRGPDSTGVIGATNDGDMYIEKAALDSHDFLGKYLGSPADKQMLKDGVVLIGHNRKGTVGKITDETAHPFVVNDDFALVHNGTLFNHKKLHDTEVDSEALARHIEEAVNTPGFSPDVMSEALADVWGAYACVWYNQRTHTVQFIRNNQRPLWIAEGPDSWYLCSEGGLLHWILSRNSITYKDLKQIPEDTLHTIRPGTERPITVEVIPEKKSPPVNPATGGTGSTTQTTSDVGKDFKKVLGSLSKNKFKQLNKRLCGRRVEFYICDYVEKYLYPEEKTPIEYKIWAESDELVEYQHVIKGEINLNRLGLYDIDDSDNHFFSGCITHCTYDARLRQLEIHVNSINKVPNALIGNRYEKDSTTVH